MEVDEDVVEIDEDIADICKNKDILNDAEIILYNISKQSAGWSYFGQLTIKKAGSR